MLYVSSSVIKLSSIKERLQKLIDVGIRNIELSGGAEYDEALESIVGELQKVYNLNYIVHNYFPSPQESFILNIASADENMRKQSVSFVKKSRPKGGDFFWS